VTLGRCVFGTKSASSVFYEYFMRPDWPPEARRSCKLVRPSVRPSVRPFVRPSVAEVANTTL